MLPFGHVSSTGRPRAMDVRHAPSRDLRQTRRAMAVRPSHRVVCERKSDAVVSIAVAAAGIVAGTWRAPMGATVLVFSVGDHNARRPPRTRIHSSSAD
jgi:hypothetical protein